MPRMQPATVSASLLGLIAALTACASGAAPVAAAGGVTPPVRPLPNDVRWVRLSAEYRAIAQQVYRTALARVTALAGERRAGSWAVILDADETVLDNSEYQRRRAIVDSGYTEASWSAWVRERAATAVPGAVEFIRAVRAEGGRIAIVTNRADSLCTATRENLRALAIDADLVLCQVPGESDKNPRFRRVQDGTAAPGVGALSVVAWIGDNIQDFPGLRQTARGDSAALAAFGQHYFILPNPMYGSWERLPPEPPSDSAVILDMVSASLWRSDIRGDSVRAAACVRGLAAVCGALPTPVWYEESPSAIPRSLAARIGIGVKPQSPERALPVCPWRQADGAGYLASAAISAADANSATVVLRLRCDNPPGYLHDHYSAAHTWQLRRGRSGWHIADLTMEVT